MNLGIINCIHRKITTEIPNSFQICIFYIQNNSLADPAFVVLLYTNVYTTKQKNNKTTKKYMWDTLIT